MVRRVSEEVFHHVGFKKEWAGRLKLVVDELFMNAVLYGSKKDESKIYVEFQFDETEAVFRIEDEGQGEQKLSAAELQQVIDKNSAESENLNKTSGRGLAMISSLWTDELKVEDGTHGGIAITFRKNVDTAKPPAPMPIVQPAEVAAPAPQGVSESMKVSGEVDASNLEEKVKPISEKVASLPAGSTLTLDCSDLIYVNSTFIGYLAGWLNELQSKQGHLSLKNTNEQIKEVLDLVGLSKVVYFES